MSRNPLCIINLPWTALSSGYNGTIRAECDIRENLDTNEYPNIFESKNLHERISEYIRIKKFYTNECPNKYSS